jgi:hypothetical protein
MIIGKGRCARRCKGRGWGDWVDPKEYEGKFQENQEKEEWGNPLGLKSISFHSLCDDELAERLNGWLVGLERTAGDVVSFWVEAGLSLHFPVFLCKKFQREKDPSKNGPSRRDPFHPITLITCCAILC